MIWSFNEQKQEIANYKQERDKDNKLRSLLIVITLLYLFYSVVDPTNDRWKPYLIILLYLWSIGYEWRKPYLNRKITSPANINILLILISNYLFISNITLRLVYLDSAGAKKLFFFISCYVLIISLFPLLLNSINTKFTFFGLSIY